MTNFSPGWNISLGTNYEIAGEESQENQNGTENTNREKRRIASLAVWPFGGAQFSAYKMMELKRNLSLVAYLSARKMYLQRKSRYLQARRVHGFPNSLLLFNLICIVVDVLTLYLSFEIRETMNTILYFIALIPLKSLLLPSGSHIAGFLLFSPVWANRARIFSPGWIAPRVESLST